MKRSEFLTDIFYFAREKNINLALARPLLTDMAQGDIDLVVSPHDVPFIDAFIAQTPTLKKTSRYIRADGETVYVYGVENGAAHAINIDLITSLAFKGIPYLDIKHVLQRATPDEKGIKTLHDIDQALILLMTHGVKHKGAIKQRSLDEMRVVLKNNPVAFPQSLVQLFGTQAALDFMDRLTENEFDNNFWRRMADAFLTQAWNWRGGMTIIDRIFYKLARLYTLCSTPRVNVAVYGVDGAGKTTLINYLEKTLAVTATQLRRPHFLPSWPWQDEANSNKALPNPHDKKLRDPFTSTLKLIYLLGRYWLAYLWPRNGTTLFIYDRSLPDMIVDPLRYRYGGSATALRWACRLAPPIKASILVDVSVETAQSRKVEVTMVETKRQSESYRQLISHLSNGIVLKGEMPIDRMTAIATAHIIQAMQDGR